MKYEKVKWVIFGEGISRGSIKSDQKCEEVMHKLLNNYFIEERKQQAFKKYHVQ